MLAFVVIIFLIGVGLAGFAFLAYRRILRRAKGIERGLKMVPILIHLPPKSSEPESNRDAREVMREKVSQAGALYDLIAGTATGGFKSRFYGQRHIAFELVATGGLIHYYTAVPVTLVSIVEKAVLTAYPSAQLEQTEDYNIFNPTAKLGGTSGGELTLKKAAAYPIASIDAIDRDPMEAVINAMSQLAPGEGAAVQIMLRPANSGWVKKAAQLAKKRRKNGTATSGIEFGVKDLAKAAITAPSVPKTGSERQITGLEQAAIDGIENKTRHAGYEVLIRVLTAAENVSRSQTILRDIVAAFALFDAPGLNGFKFLPATQIEGLVTAFIFRFFPPELNHDILNSQELALLYHLPDGAVTATSQVQRQAAKQVDGPPVLPTEGLLLGYNEFRGQRKEIHLSPEDRRRHTYIVGQTGTGKSVILENMAVQDMLAGNGFAFIDPHGDTAEKLISMVPKNRVEDVIYFNPGDTEYPLGLNIFEMTSPEQRDFLIQEAINMIYKIYDPQKQGIVGPRFEQWFRNAAITIMSDPAGATFIEIPKVFTDTEYLKAKFKYLTDPTTIEFWTKEMAQTSDYHKSEMLGWFASKFGAFQQNAIMRNIMGQTKSAFNLREIMDQKKILIVNLSKGLIGDLNSQYLGMIFVIKFQAAAMSRANVPDDQRPDFCLYVDEFQNFSTDSFASILSEARKYRLNLIVANQFIGQLTPEIRDAVFGNVGTMISFRTGPEDADFLVKQFAPVFDAHDLVNLEIGHAAVRLLIGGLPSQPFSVTTLPPLDLANPELGLAVKQLSAAKFGASKAQVEATIFERLRSGGSGAAAVTAPAPPPSTAPTPQPLADATMPAATVMPSAGNIPAGPRAPMVDAASVRPVATTAAATFPTPVATAVLTAPVASSAPVSPSFLTATTPSVVAPKPPSAHNALSIDDITKHMPPPPLRPAQVSPLAAVSNQAPVLPVASGLPAPVAAIVQQAASTAPTTIAPSSAAGPVARQEMIPAPAPAPAPAPNHSQSQPSITQQPASEVDKGSTLEDEIKSAGLGDVIKVVGPNLTDASDGPTKLSNAPATMVALPQAPTAANAGELSASVSSLPLHTATPQSSVAAPPVVPVINTTGEPAHNTVTHQPTPANLPHPHVSPESKPMDAAGRKPDSQSLPHEKTTGHSKSKHEESKHRPSEHRTQEARHKAKGHSAGNHIKDSAPAPGPVLERPVVETVNPRTDEPAITPVKPVEAVVSSAAPQLSASEPRSKAQTDLADKPEAQLPEIKTTVQAAHNHASPLVEGDGQLSVRASSSTATPASPTGAALLPVATAPVLPTKTAEPLKQVMPPTSLPAQVSVPSSSATLPIKPAPLPITNQVPPPVTLPEPPPTPNSITPTVVKEPVVQAELTTAPPPLPPGPEPIAATPKSNVPAIPAGEIYVDADGTVHMGE